jgi:hypothetical protein
LTTMFGKSKPDSSPVSGQGVGGGIVQNFGVKDEILFLEISLSENWLIFITRANGPFWSSIPSWQLTGAILLVDILATMFCLFGWFIGGNTSIVAIVRVWIFVSTAISNRRELHANYLPGVRCVLRDGRSVLPVAGQPGLRQPHARQVTKEGSEAEIFGRFR